MSPWPSLSLPFVCLSFSTCIVKGWPQKLISPVLPTQGASCSISDPLISAPKSVAPPFPPLLLGQHSRPYVARTIIFQFHLAMHLNLTPIRRCLLESPSQACWFLIRLLLSLSSDPQQGTSQGDSGRPSGRGLGSGTSPSHTAVSIHHTALCSGSHSSFLGKERTIHLFMALLRVRGN